MQLEVGKIYEGKVTGITKFGAFVELDKDTTGMVHISEVANTFVSEIKDTSMDAKSSSVPISSGVTLRILVRSMFTTRSSVRSFQASWP